MAVNHFAVPLDRIERCFEGLIPTALATSSLSGAPNVMGVSHVHLIDERHVAISRQFFRKTHANLA